MEDAVTDEMIEAGLDALHESGVLTEEETVPSWAESAIKEIFLAMIARFEGHP